MILLPSVQRFHILSVAALHRELEAAVAAVALHHSGFGDETLRLGFLCHQLADLFHHGSGGMGAALALAPWLQLYEDVGTGSDTHHAADTHSDRTAYIVR